MAVCNTFKKLSKETGTFLTFGQYVEDLTAWKVLSNYYNIVPSKFVAIDCQTKLYDNRSFPQALQELFENGCACFKNDAEFKWNPSYTKTLFWNTLFNIGVLQKESVASTDYIKGIKYVGDINIQSYNEVDGMGYSEIYCHIPNEAPAQKYSFYTNSNSINKVITRSYNSVIEGFKEGELNGAEQLTLLPKTSEGNEYEYKLTNDYTFSWEDDSLITTKLEDSSFKVNLIVVLYDILDSDNQKTYENIPMGIYVTGLFKNGNIQNAITKYVSNEDIYNSGTSYGLRICTKFVAAGVEDNYVIKEVTCEDNNHADLSRVLSQLSISQNKMDEILNNKYMVDQNYKNLLAVFKNSKTNVPYIKRVNDNDYWFVNGKMLGPSITENLFEPYSNTDIKNMINSNITSLFQIIASVSGESIYQDPEDNSYYVFDYSADDNKIKLKWETRYDDITVTPSRLTVNNFNYTNTNHLTQTISFPKFKNIKTVKYNINAEYNSWNAEENVTVYAVNPLYYGNLNVINNTSTFPSIESNQAPSIHEQLQNAINDGKLQKLIKYNGNITQELSTDINTENICYIYPEYYGNLKNVTDFYGNTYSINNSETSGDEKDFNLYKLQLMIHNNTVVYNAYVSKGDIHVNGYTLNFEVEYPTPAN